MKKVALQVKDKAIEDKVMRDFDVIRENGKLTVYLKDNRDLSKLILDVEYEDIEVITPTLEDIFLKVVGFKLRED